MIAQVNEVSGMEKIVEQGLLYDFYGELLTDHQKAIYEDVVINDMSLSEIAREQGISRQGVHDMIKRCDRILNGYEEKLGLVEKSGSWYAMGDVRLGQGRDAAKQYLVDHPDECDALEESIRKNFHKLMSNPSKVAARAAGRAVDVSADDFDDAD